MSDSDFDVNDIVYANNQSKITLKTKKKLDDLAAQVTLWNLELSHHISSNDNFSSYYDIKYQIPTTKETPSKNLFRVDGKSTPTNKQTICNSANVNFKKARAYFENLSADANNKINKPIQPRNLRLPLKVNERNINNDKIPHLANTYDQPMAIRKFDFPLEIDDIGIIKENIPPNQNILSVEQEDDDESFPHPPSDISEADYNISSLKSSNSSLDHETPLETENFSYMSQLTPSRSTFSLYNEFVNELEKIIKPDTDSLGVKKVDKSLRRSLSFNDTVEYIYPSSQEDSQDEFSQFNSVDLMESSKSSQRIFEHSTSFLEVTTSEDLMCSVTNLEAEKKDLEQRQKSLLEEYRKKLAANMCTMGDRVHTKICHQMVRNALVMRSLTEKIETEPTKIGVIDGYLQMKSLSFAVKDDFVLIDYEELVKMGYWNQLKRLRDMFHLILFVRCQRDTNVSESRIYTLVERLQAHKLKLPHQTLGLLEMFCFINFHKLSAGFRLKFDLYCMHVMPKKQPSKIFGTPKRYVTQTDNHISSSFNNIGSFEVTAQGLILNKEKITKKLNVPRLYPLTGRLTFDASLTLNLIKTCCGRLSVFKEVGGVGSWSFRNCEITPMSIIIGKATIDSGVIDDIDFEIPFHMCKGTASLCNYNICPKAFSFSIMLLEDCHSLNICVNRRLSIDGKKKNRFLAAAESTEDALRWCAAINSASESLADWAHDIY